MTASGKITPTPPAPPIRLERRSLPQLRAVDIDRFVHELRRLGITVEAGRIAVECLDPVQEEFKPSKIESKARSLALNPARVKPFIVSLDGYIIDSHHQWAALRHTRPREKVRIWLVHLPILALISEAKRFERQRRRETLHSQAHGCRAAKTEEATAANAAPRGPRGLRLRFK